MDILKVSVLSEICLGVWGMNEERKIIQKLIEESLEAKIALLAHTVGIGGTLQALAKYCYGVGDTSRRLGSVQGGRDWDGIGEKIEQLAKQLPEWIDKE